MTTNAIRAQLAAMERDGLVRRVGQKRGATRPSHVFEVTAEVEQLLSGMYVPLLIHLVRVFSKNLQGDQLRLGRPGHADPSRHLHALCRFRDPHRHRDGDRL